MDTLPLDLDDLISELRDADELQALVPSATRIGHVHLQVSDLERAEQFYSGVLGFDVVVRHYPGALFVSAGGYHHHIGMNTWHSAGSPPPAPGAVGLRSFTIVLPDTGELKRLKRRIEAAGLAVEHTAPTLTLRDPFASQVVLRTP